MPKISFLEWFESVGFATTPLGLASRAMTMSAITRPDLAVSTSGAVDFPSVEYAVRSLIVLAVGAYFVPWLGYCFTRPDPRLSNRRGRICLAPPVVLAILAFFGFALLDSRTVLMVAAVIQAIYAVALFVYFHVTNPARKPSASVVN
jgi:hypothetical protein